MKIKHRVIYADTDHGGFVYYGKYLEFLERARTELIRESGVSIAELAKKGFIAPVVHVSVDYKAPARYDDELEIEVEITKIGTTSLTFEYKIYSDSTLSLEATTVNVFVNKDMKKVPIPKEITIHK